MPPPVSKQLHLLNWNEILPEPYRLLFPLGFILASIGIGIWIPYYLLPQTFPYPGPAHAIFQIQGFLLSFILGFLLTMLPKVLGIRPVGRLQLLLFPFGLVTLSICSWINAPQVQTAVQILHLSLIGNFLVFILRRWPERKGSPPAPFVFIPMAMAADMIGTGMRILVTTQMTETNLLRAASLLQFQAFPLLLILGIGGFLLPKLFGNAVVDPRALRDQPGSPLLPPLALGTGLLLSYGLEAASPALGSGMLLLRLAYALRACIWAWFTLGQLRLLKIPGKLPAYLAAIRISLLSMGAGMALPIFFPSYLLAWEHLIFISGFLWLTLSVAARVMTAHGGRLEILDRHRKQTVGYGAMIFLALISRIATDIWTGGHWLHLALAAAFALIALALWGWIFLPLIFSVPGRTAKAP